MTPDYELSFLDIFNAIPDIMGLQDTKGRVLQYNEAGYRFLGLKPEDVNGRFCYELIGRNVACTECATREAIRTGEPATIVKYDPENKTWFSASTYPVKDENGEVIRVIEHLRDITESKALQVKLEQLNEGLESQVEERTRELKGMVEDLTNTRDRLIESEKLSAIGQMVAGFSHELNTPLGVAITSVSYLKEQIVSIKKTCGSDFDTNGVYADIIENLEQACGLVDRNLQRASELISGFKRIAVDQASEEQRVVDIHEYLEDLVRSLHYETRNRDVSLSLEGGKGCRLPSSPS